ncbi:hypothetical protein DFP72DRAFT_1114265 [Ephemerocybe angulata]|uniref:F-box domain-containing protein n=1 Tax=Ephemerocybe angulata TaxID=980116 RepID=A0A8H6I2N9_9AGAR|nr:hypothetical protein DFP72DRAFT_1114265 [Tulosesus angulatus]
MSSPSCNSLETQELRTELLQRLAELDEETRALKSRYNALAPTTHVPTEVLSHIFLFLRDELAEDLLSDSTDSLRQSWIRITRVCHHWREVALGCPALWADLRFSHPGLTRAMIQRSRNFPLTIIFDERSSKGMSLDLHDALSEAHRLQSVQLRFQSSNSQFYFKEWHGETPLLKDLSIETSKRDPLTEELESVSMLSTVERPSVGTKLDEPKIVSESFQNRRRFPSVEVGLFCYSTHMVNIQDLHLDWRSIPNGLIHSHYPMVLFPALRTLKLADEISVVSGFLSVFRIPEDACVNISCYKDLEDPTSVNLFLLKLREAWPKLQMGAQSLRLVESWGSTTAGINYLTNSDEDESLTSAGG